jgi:hypothetical protein
VSDPRYRFGNATTADFKNLAENISGQELDWFFEQWVYRAGRPELRYAWKWEGGELIFRLLQTQSGNPYRLPFDLAAIAGADTLRFTIEHTSGFQEYRFAADKQITRVLVDPDYWVLKNLQQVDFNSLNVDGGIVPFTFALQPIRPNPFIVGAQPLVVNFSLSRNENVRLTVFNTLGQEIATLLAKRLTAGNHAQPWDGRQANGEPAPSGIYFMRLQTETAQATKRFVVLR